MTSECKPPNSQTAGAPTAVCCRSSGLNGAVPLAASHPRPLPVTSARACGHQKRQPLQTSCPETGHGGDAPHPQRPPGMCSRAQRGPLTPSGRERAGPPPEWGVRRGEQSPQRKVQVCQKPKHATEPPKLHLQYPETPTACLPFSPWLRRAA